MFLLTASDINLLIKRIGVDIIMDTLISTIESGFNDFDESCTFQPARSGFNTNGLIEWMPILYKQKSVVLKLVSYFPENPSNYQIATVQAYITRNECQSGKLLDLVEGGLLTAMRTGAASAVASRHLANKDSSILGIVGCGAQSVTQAHAICRVFPIKEILVFDVSDTALKSIYIRLQFLGIKVTIASLEVVEEKADIICTVTSVEIGAGPVIQGDKLKAHVHINAVGSDYPGKFEIPQKVLTKSLVVPDHYEQAIKEGECQNLTKNFIGPELHQIIKKPIKYQDWKYRTTVFDSTGIPLEDAITLDVICMLARQENLGIDIEFLPKANDPKNPYENCVSNLTFVRN